VAVGGGGLEVALEDDVCLFTFVCFSRYVTSFD